MLFSKFFWKMYVAFAVLVVVTTMSTGLVIHARLKHEQLGDIENTLKSEAVMLDILAESALVSGMTPTVTRQVAEIAGASGTLVSLLRADGHVVVDSQQLLDSNQDESDRPEIVAAEQGVFGTARRYDRALQDEVLYVARAIYHDGRRVGFARVALPLHAIAARLVLLRKIIAAGAGFGILAALGVGWLVTRRITAPIVAITKVAQAIRQGEYGQRLPILPRDELGLLGDTINQLAAEMTQTIATLAQDRAQLAAMLGAMTEGVVAVDERDCVWLCNDAAQDLLRVTGGDPVGRRVWEVTRHADLLALVQSARDNAQVARREFVVHSTGEAIVLQAHAVNFASGARRGVIVVLHDVTSLRRLERIRSEFVANVSHEFKTPLTAIKGYVETLLGGALHDADNNERFLHKIDDHVSRLSQLVHELLQLAKIESVDATPTLAPVEWSAIAGDVVARYENLAQQKQLQCVVESAPACVMGHAASMQQILDNLLSNAIKYTPAGGTITGRMGVRDHSGWIEIADTGIGIAQGEQERIFERFYRVDKSRTRDSGGAGLGLAIVKHLVANLHGTIRCESTPGAGSRFVVELPAVVGQ